ncbi:hypothetical protein FDP41_003094 [Naegleria fowleri]|uniref:V-SNARE coiled-coil homology domain-containing protein n=1 Tax=Naegleria fowleri TaxID=5763 RepID=A0A6A5BSS4_NAEFO|nr:uncharacterized protein FDP41_003094 [Naegleria fowleri]KAF0977772.1 hypothetical protein FDP41_003094 [Naegleria fowleri]CAG4707678.1 unnamed protein product [Naegleria fowleri]
MVILYTCVVMDRKIIAEYPTGKKDMMQLINNLLEYIPNREHKKSLNYESKSLRVHYECSDEDEKEPTHRYFTVISVTDEMTPYRVVFGLKSGFFKDIQKEVRQKYTKGNRNQKNSMLRSFIQQKMTEWNDPNKDKLTHLGYEISKNKSKMIDNIDKILQNHERMDSLIDRTSLLVDNSDHFQKQAKKLKNVMIWNNIKIFLILIGVLAVIAFIGIWLGCGFPDFKRCSVGTSQPASTDVI